MIAAWKIAWKGEVLEPAVVAGARDIIDYDGGEIYEVVRRTADVENEDCEHWAKGAPCTASFKFPRWSVSANTIDVTMLDACFLSTPVSTFHYVQPRI